MGRLVKFECPLCGTPVLTEQPAGATVTCGWCRQEVRVRDESPFTAADWQTGTDAHLMLQFARRHAPDRKLWLFAYACSRRILDRIVAAMEGAEVAPADPAARRQAHEAAWFIDDVRRFLNGGSPEWAQAGTPTPQALASAIWGQSTRDLDEAEIAVQMALLRDVVGDPFRPAEVAPSVLAWEGGTVVKLARAIFDSRNFAELPVLADALEEAGCADEAILAHCRRPGPHVRGCWVVDLILARD